MNSVMIQHNKKIFMLVLALVAAISSILISIAYFTDRANRTTTIQTATFDAEGYELTRTAPDGFLTSGETAEVTLKESNNKSEDISSQITLTASWDSPVPDIYPWGNSNTGNIQISLDGEEVSYTENKKDNTISFALPENALSSGASDVESTLLYQIPSDLAATGTLKFSFDHVELHSGEWTYECEKDTLTALDFTADVAWNISKDQTTAMDNPNRDVLALLASGATTDEYTLNIIKNGSDTNTNYGQMMNWTAKNQTPWAKHNITDLSLSEGITTIGCYAFAGETGITELSLPNTVNTIGISAFQGSGLSGELVLPSTIKIIESLAFGDLTDVDTITFEHGSDDSLTLPDNTSEGEGTSGAFYVSDYVKTTLNFNGNTVSEQYDWVADQRMKVGISSATLSYEKITVGDTAEPVLIISPTNYDDYQSIKYELTAGNDYAEIDADTGALTGKAGGTVTVQVTIIDGNGKTVQANTDVIIQGEDKALGDTNIGDTVYLKENGTPVAYIVVNQGLPGNSSLYDSSCDGIWLLRKEVYENQVVNSDGNNSYARSVTHTYLNSTFLSLFDSKTQAAIQQVKLPHVDGWGTSTVYSGTSGLSTKVFLLGNVEVGFSSDGEMAVTDGAKLSYFTSNSARIAYLNGTATGWWTRSPKLIATNGYSKDISSFWIVNTSGTRYWTGSQSNYGIRPALIMPSNINVDQDGVIDGSLYGADILDSIIVTKQPDKTTYTEGETFDPTGLEVTVTYKDGSTKTVSADELTVKDGSELSVDQSNVTISYTENDQTIEITVPITVEKLPIAMEDAEIGSTVILDVDGAPTEFIIVHQGNPDSTLYDASCDGTWLLMKDIYELRQWHSSENNTYASSTIHSYLNSTFLSLLESNVQSSIKQVKIPYCAGSGYGTSVSGGANGLSTKIFLLSGMEAGLGHEGLTETDGLPKDGVLLSYFSSIPNRIAYLNGTGDKWWLRSPHGINSGSVWAVQELGLNFNNYPTYAYGIRPAMILPGDAIIKGDGTLDVSNVYFDIDSEPSQSGTLTYTGEEQTVTWDNYDSTQLTISGTTSAIAAGTYTATFTPKEHYRWSDGTTDAKAVEWTIKKAEGSLSLSSTTIELDEGSTATIEVTRAGDGVISGTSSDKSVATVSVDGTTITVTGVAAGNAAITIAVAEGTNHKAPANATVVTTINTTGIAAGSLAVGSSVYLNENGSPVEYLVVNQGIPGNSSLYDSSCNGTWLLRKDAIQPMTWGAYQYSDSNVHTYFNGTFLSMFDSAIQASIKQVKIPHAQGAGSTYKPVSSGSSGLSTKVFSLSVTEAGYTGNPVDGATLTYFANALTSETAIKAARIAYYEGTAVAWSTRTPYSGYQQYMYAFTAAGATNYYANMGNAWNLRPALILPSDCTLDADGFIVAPQ